jgi:CheY-like chemotaxis protein
MVIIYTTRGDVRRAFGAETWCVHDLTHRSSEVSGREQKPLRGTWTIGACEWSVFLVTVLVVEDEPLLRLNISEELREEGYQVVVVANADDAIQVLETRTDIRTIFTDIRMPGSMDGLKLAAAVRNRWPPINIVITTGTAPPSPDQMPDHSIFLPKPYRRADVVGALRSFGSG